MYTKKILSTAAAVALLSTGLVAFETTDSGAIKKGTIDAGYTGGVPAVSELNVSDNQLGDALVYPYFRDNGGWATEIVVRNTTPHATIAKVSLYEFKDSNDIGDFNIYLSPYDVFRFTIKDGKVLTKDGSIPVQVTNPRYGKAHDKSEFIESDSSASTDALEVLTTLDSDSSHEGYVIIYGMTQYHDGDARSTSASGDNTGLNYHHKHKELWADYRRLLDDCRPNWRNAYTQGGMVDGMMTINVPAPDVNIGCATVSDSIMEEAGHKADTDTNTYNLENFGDVDSDTFIGTVRVYQEDDVAPRDLLLQATALKNFTDGNMNLWAEGEYAAIQDRDIEQSAGDAHSTYNEDKVLADSKTFLVKSVYYTFNANDVANQILVTQPLKKALGQLKPQNGTSTGEYWIDDTTTYGGFRLDYFLRDEDENQDVEEVTYGFERITSPHSVGVDGPAPTYKHEMQKIENLQNEAANDAFKDTDGFAYVNFVGGSSEGLPAIVTQMVGTKVSGVSQTNWIYAPTVE